MRSPQETDSVQFRAHKITFKAFRMERNEQGYNVRTPVEAVTYSVDRPPVGVPPRHERPVFPSEVHKPQPPTKGNRSDLG